jgi:hypothetical protein
MKSNYSEQREIVSSYKGLLDNLDNLITQSDFKMTFFLDKLNMKRTTFYNKRKNQGFEPGEVDSILKLLSRNE